MNESEQTQAAKEAARDHAGEAAEHAKSAARNAHVAAGQAVEETVDDLSHKARQHAETFRRQAGEYADQAGVYAEQGREQLAEAQPALEAYVREKPLMAVIIAAVVGFLVGAILKRD
ncbi:MAG: hypothetical protein ACFCVE_02455 [Phycisphaerae bacterium]